MERADVCVIGGGPAGLAAAIAARQRGLSVIVVDALEPPIDKACGEGLLPETQEALGELGVAVSSEDGCRFRGIRFVERGTQVSAEFPAGQGIGIRRTLLHQKLVERAEDCGAQLRWQTTVMGIAASVVKNSRGEIAARWIVGADGSSSRVRRWSGLQDSTRNTWRHAKRRHYHMKPWSPYAEVHWAKQVQAYVTPIGAEEVCIVVLAELPGDADFAKALGKLPELHERLCGAELASRERGAVTAMHGLTRVTRGNVALVGDASGGVDAITGEGLRLAFRQSLALAEAMGRNDLSGYERAHRELARRPLRMGKLMLLVGRNQRLRQRSFAALASKPQLFEDLLAIHVGQASRTEIVGTGLELGWQFLTA
ncbi:MAG TPA: NAD(P)/FAD-dependent oxidoreductase [Candidatus Dormibacteraeota bacterium]|nr:NAD(P)/FAD-dependent oxidoreductase [Candidatus Dormibacteraeota bacterium]